jgi:lysophospholipase L1-like esterase
LKKLVAITCFSLVILTAAGQQKKGSPFPSEVKRVLFLGNSITYAGDYISNVEAYLVARYPNITVDFVNAGLPSETVSGLSEPGHAGGKFERPDLHERLGRTLEATKPDWVYACYGMNDGIYMPLDAERFAKFKEGTKWLHDQLKKAGVKKIIHLTPPVFDERQGGHPGYAHVLDVYSEWLLRQREKAGWDVADVHGAMKAFLEFHIQQDTLFALAADGVHPAATGHWVMAKVILLHLGETEVGNTENIHDAMSSFQNGNRIFELVAQRQLMMKDAWLTIIGHRRPGMTTGLPMNEVTIKAEKIQREIDALRE